MPQRELFPDAVDPCAGKHGGNPESRLAWQRVSGHVSDTEAEIWEWIESRGEHGATAKEVARHLGRPLNAISGRCSRLRQLGMAVVATDEDGKTVRREDSAVLVVIKK